MYAVCVLILIYNHCTQVYVKILTLIYCISVHFSYARKGFTTIEVVSSTLFYTTNLQISSYDLEMKPKLLN